MAALFVKLLNLSIAAGWLILAAALLRLVLRGAPKALRCVLWALAGVRLVCPFSVQSALSLLPSAQTVPRESLYSPSPTIHSGISALNQAVNPVISQSLAPETGAVAPPLQTAMTAAGAVWVAGMAAMLLYAAVSYVRLRRRVAAAVPLRENLWLCDNVDAPFILGIFRPRVYFPSAIGEGELPHVIAHEKAHISRRDHWWKPLGFALLSVYWFNPVIWLAYILLCRDIELACDEKVVKGLGTAERKAYSQALLACSTPRGMVSACPLAFGEVGVKARIQAVLNYKKPAFWVVLLAVAACAVLAVCFLTSPKEQPAPGAGNGPEIDPDVGFVVPRPPAVALTGLAPGGVYVSWNCLYMNPLSSYAAIGGDSGCRYRVEEDAFVIVNRAGGGERRLTVEEWGWREFPYTDEEWAALYKPGGFGAVGNLSQRYGEMLYQPLSAGEFLLRMDGELWLVETSANDRMGTYLWSIYSLVPEEDMGSAQWRYTPLMSSRYPAFPFAFDMEYTQISAVCVDSPLVGFDDNDGSGHPSAHHLIFPAGSAVYWSPTDGGGVAPLSESEVHFTVHNGERMVCAGTIYITRCQDRGDGVTRAVYAATVVGAGLHMAQNSKGEGAVISFTP